MWEPGKKYEVDDPANSRLNNSAEQRINKPSIKPPIVPAKRAGWIGKAILVTGILVTPTVLNPPSDKGTLPSTPSPVMTNSKILLTDKSIDKPIDPAVLPVSPSASSKEPVVVEMVGPPKPEIEPVVVEMVGPPKPEIEPVVVKVEPMFVRVVYLTPPLVDKPIFDIVGE